MAVNIVRGSDTSLSITLQEVVCGVTLPHDLTSKTVSVKYKDSTNIVITKTTPTGVTIVNAVYGQITLNLSDTDTEGLKLGGMAIDVYVDDAGDTKIFQFAATQVTVVDRIR